VLFFSRAGLRDALELGIRGEFVPLGVRARRDEAAPPGSHLLAVGRDHRDWDTLARASQGLDIEVRVVGPSAVPGPLQLVDPVPREELFALMEQAAAVVVPLADRSRTAGQLAVLDAFAVGRGVVATLGPGTEDYVTDDTGFLVPPGEADPLRAALALAADPGVAATIGSAALAEAHSSLSLTSFVAAVDAFVR
jgi:glycosyltransferase involved in cell wall biosynthesis